MLLLGIDVGTGGTRALVIDERGGIVASATAEHAPFSRDELEALMGLAVSGIAELTRLQREALA